MIIKKQVIITYTGLSISWIILMVVIFSFVLTGCVKETITGTGRVITEQRPISPFSEVDIRGIFQVQLSQDGHQPLRIEAEENIMRVIETGVNDKTLFIRIKGNTNIRRQHPVKIYVHSTLYERISFTGDGKLTTADTLRCTALRYSTAGTADAELTVVAKTIGLQTDGSGKIRIGGYCDKATGNINGVSEVDGVGLQTEEATIAIHGTGDHSIHAQRTLDASIYGSGNVRYKGKPVLRTKIYGLGKVIPI